MTVLITRLAAIFEGSAVARDRLDRLVARLANQRERRRAIRLHHGSSG